MQFMWEALIILLVGFILLRIVGKKTVSEMTGLEIITLLSMASLVGHAVSEQALWKTIVALCIFVLILITVQYIAIRFDFVERMMMGKATLVIKDGKLVPHSLKKLRISVDQLEARLRQEGIESISDVKTGTIEMSGQLGYELMRHAKPVTIGDLEKILYQKEPPSQESAFQEVVQKKHQKKIPSHLD